MLQKIREVVRFVRFRYDTMYLREINNNDNFYFFIILFSF